MSVNPPTKTRGVAVHLEGVTKTFGTGDARVQALRGIDLDVYTGELMMLVGPSGCGKTTLISIIAAILNHDGGKCQLFGEDVHAFGGYKKTRYRGTNIGFVFQAYNLIPSLNSAENVAVPLMINGMARGPATKKARDMLSRVGFDDRLMRAFPNQLSGGQQQRVAIGRALVHDPRLIVCDEPTAALDHDNGQKVMAVLRAVAIQPGRALIVVTHDARIFSFADRIARMDDGRVDSVEEVTPDLRARVGAQAVSHG